MLKTAESADLAPTIVHPGQGLAIAPPEIDPSWQLLFLQLTKPIDCGDEDFLYLLREYDRLVAVEMMRLKWGLPIRFTKLPKEAKKEIGLRGELAYRLLNLISETWLIKSCGYVHPAEWLAYVWDEDQASCLHWPGNSNKSAIISGIRQQNGDLASYTNPFDAPHSKNLFDKGIAFANTFQNFNDQVYRPFIRARKAVATLLAKRDTRANTRTSSGGIKTLRQGRKK